MQSRLPPPRVLHRGTTVCRRLPATLAVALLSALALGDDAPPRVLAPGAAVEGDLRHPGRARFTVDAQAGDRLAVTLVQRGVDLVLSVADPTGRPLLERDDAGGVAGSETLSWIAGVAGAHRIEIRPRFEGSAGSFEIRSDATRPATPVDRDRASADRALSDGARLLAETGPDARTGARVAYEDALRGFEALGDARGQALALTGLGRTAYALADFGTAVERFRQSLDRWRVVGDVWQQGYVLGRIGEALVGQGKAEQSVPVLTEALSAFRETGDRRNEAQSLNDLGAAHEVRGAGPDAMAAYENALAIRREVGDRRGEVETLTNIGARYFHSGQPQLSLDYFLQALAASRAVGDRPGETFAVMAVGQLYTDLGDYTRALIHLDQGLALARELGDRRAEATTYAAMGYAYRLSGAPAEAREAYSRSLEIARAMGDRVSEAQILRNLAVVASQAGQHAPAREAIEKALAMVREAGDSRGEAAVLSVRCRILGEAGELDGAQAAGLEALELAQRVDVPRVRISTLYWLAQVEMARGALAAAEARIREALDLLESQRRSLRSADLRAVYVASVRSFYDLHVHVLMARHAAQPSAGFDQAALQAAERSRARSLLELLTESQANIREGVDAGLLERERSLRTRLSDAAERGVRGAAPGSEAAKTLASEVESLSAQMEDVEAEIRRSSPRYAALTQPQPLPVAELQSMLDDDTVLLQYSLGSEASYVWAVTARAVVSARLPPRDAIEATARRVSQAWATRTGGDAAAAELSRLVLVPVADSLSPRRRLVIVADGALHYVPFQALPDPATREALVVGHEVVGLPSASALALLRSEQATRPPARRLLAVLADPVFDASDERVPSGSRRQKENAPPPGGNVVRAIDAAGFAGAIPRLPFSRREAQAILAGVPADSRLAAFDFDASREVATDGRLADYRFVHLATHGFFNSTRPELSGVVLSLVDREGRPRPGFLTAADVFNLRLSADLVALSGCRTALGRDVSGEGLVGLNRGFMYAGATRVLASLWPVDDAATAALMTKLYARLLTGPHPQRPAEALRSAQLEMLREPRYQHPFYWAGFQLQGEWR
jgi:CHAT domain-containing protein